MMKVLIVDDEIKVCNLMCNLVDWKALGLEIAGVVNDGESALQMVDELQPDIVITDIRMPGYSGIELIQQVRQTNQKIRFIIISGYQQFEYANQAIKFGVEDYLLKPLKQTELERILRKIVQRHANELDELCRQDMLARQMRQSIEQLQGHFLQLLMNPMAWEQAKLNLAAANERYHCGFGEGGYRLLLIQATMDGTATDASADYLLTKKLLDQLKTELEPNYQTTLASLLDGMVVCLLQGTEEQFGALRIHLKRISFSITALRDVFETMDATMALSAVAADFSGLPDCVRQARMALQQRMFVPTRELLEYSDACEPDCAVEIVLDAPLREDLRRQITLLDEDAIIKALGPAEERLRQRKPSGWLVAQTYRRVLELFADTMRENRVELPEGFLDDGLTRLRTARTFNDALGELRRYLQDTVAQLRQSRSAEDTRPIRRAKQYILDHYAEPITLGSISQDVGLNASYFSALFKKETGQNFVDYLCEVRIDVAKELLVETDMSIGEIAEKVGYNDMKYFYKRFRQSTGVSLKEYRKLYH